MDLLYLSAMKTHLTALLSLVILAAATPVLRAEQKLDRADIRLSIPDNWVEAPDVAESALKATVGTDGQVEASTLSYRHPSKVPVVLGIFVRSKQPVGTDVRQELKIFHNSMKKAIEKGGATFTRFELMEGAQRMTSAFEATQGGVKMQGLAIAAVRTDGKLLAWSVECIYAADQALDAQVSAEVVASFRVVHPVEDLRALNK
jgi:hypothetical protein